MRNTPGSPSAIGLYAGGEPPGDGAKQGQHRLDPE